MARSISPLLQAAWSCQLLVSGMGCTPETPLGARPSEAGLQVIMPERAVHGVERRVEPGVATQLAFTSRTVELRAPFGATAMSEIRLTGRLAPIAQLRVETIDPAGPEVVVVPCDGEKPQGLRLTLAGTHVGSVAGQVLVATGLEDPTTLTVLYSSKVTGNLLVDPTNPFIDVHVAAPAVAVVRVTSSREDLRLDDARVRDGPFEATFSRDQSGHGYVVKVAFRAEQASEQQRGALGTLRLLSNDPAEPEKDVPLFALGSR